MERGYGEWDAAVLELLVPNQARTVEDAELGTLTEEIRDPRGRGLESCRGPIEDTQ